jgi:hypothetical protein
MRESKFQSCQRSEQEGLDELLSPGMTQCQIASLSARGTGLFDCTASLLKKHPAFSPDERKKHLRAHLSQSGAFIFSSFLITSRQAFCSLGLTLQLGASPNTGRIQKRKLRCRRRAG